VTIQSAVYSNNVSNNCSRLMCACVAADDQHISRANDVSWMTSRPALGPAVRPPTKLTRKMSVDCLLDHFNCDDYVDPSKTTGSGYQLARPLTLARRSPSGYFNGSSSMTSSRSASVDSCGARNLSRPPLQLRTDLFRPYPSSAPPSSAPTSGSSLDGLLTVSVYCGRGLASPGSRAGMQELYCVVTVDGVSRARTGVHSGATNFDWDDRFMVDVRCCSALSFGVYSFDSRAGGRHRLCFTASVSLPSVIRRGGSEEDCRERLAVKLDPRGILYVELSHRNPADAFRRRPAVDVDAVFGAAVTGPGETPDVAPLVRSCVEEVERRGAAEQAGIYRLCGSAKRAARLRSDLEIHGPQGVNLSQSAVGDVNVVTGQQQQLLT